MDAQGYSHKNNYLTPHHMIILGIDPGTRIAGFAVIKKEQRATLLLDCGYITMAATKPLHERVGIFHAAVDNLIKQWQVTDLALETPFLHKNAQNFLKLGYMRGILYLLVDHHKLGLHEFSPMQVKQAVTGYGGASKEQVARVIIQLFPQFKEPEKADVTDALAVTLCGLWHSPQKRM